MQYLSQHTVTGCVEPRVQSTFGPVFPALLQLRLKPCTRFQLSQMFYHHLDHPYIQAKQREYLAVLAASRPVFILDDGQFGYYNRFSKRPLPPLPHSRRRAQRATRRRADRSGAFGLRAGPLPRVEARSDASFGQV